MKLLGTDFDGTLYLNNQIADETLNAIKKWQKAGNLFGIITGRDHLMITDKLKEYDLNLDFLIGNNGAQINGLVAQPLRAIEIKQLLVGSFVEQAEQIMLFTETAHLAAIQKANSKLHMRQNPQLKKMSLSELRRTTEATQVSYQFLTSQEARKCAEKINLVLGENLQASQNNHCVDVVPRGIDKAVGLKNYLKSAPAEIDEIVVIGDGQNDKEMIEQFAGYSLEHAATDVKQLAKGIVSSVGELIERHLSNDL